MSRIVIPGGSGFLRRAPAARLVERGDEVVILSSSRRESSRCVSSTEAIGRCSTRPRMWVQSSSLAVFGDGGDAVLDECSTPTGIGPREMVTVCLAWDGAAAHGIGLGGRNDPARRSSHNSFGSASAAASGPDAGGCHGSGSTTCSRR